MTQIVISGGKRFEAQPDENLLAAALRQGLLLGHSCKTGRCSSCKCRLLSGESVAVQEELGLSVQERAAGWILSCVRQARSDLVLEVEAEDLGGLCLPPSKIVPVRIQTLQKLSDDVLKVQLRMPPGSALVYYPGQYIDVIGPGGIRRSYSLANAPRPDQSLELHVRAVEGGAMSRYWFEQAKPNDLLRIEGPLGSFFVRGAAGRDVILLATGTGMAPVKAILEGLAMCAAENRPSSISVYWGGRLPEDLYWDPSYADLELRYVPVLSRAATSWARARGHVQDVLLAESRPKGITDSLVYACGSQVMIETARRQLLAAGLPASQFFADAFVCSARALT